MKEKKVVEGGSGDTNMEKKEGDEATKKDNNDNLELDEDDENNDTEKVEKKIADVVEEEEEVEMEDVEQIIEEIEYIKHEEKKLDFDNYFLHYVTSPLVHQYMYLLSKYMTNSKGLNKCVVDFLQKVKDIKYDGGNLEPILWSLSSLRVYNVILNDTRIINNPDFKSMITLVSGIVRHISRGMVENPVLCVELLFKAPFRFLIYIFFSFFSLFFNNF